MTTSPPHNPTIVQDFLNGLSARERRGDDDPLVVYCKEQIDPTSLVALEELLLQCPPSSLPSVSLTPGEQLLLSHIQQQTRIMYQLQERIDGLQQQIFSLTDNQSDDNGSNHRQSAPSKSAPMSPGVLQKRSSDAAGPATPEVPAPVRPPILLRRNPPPNARRQQLQNRWRRHLIHLQTCGTLYVELHRRYHEQQRQRNNNPNIDPFFLLKVLFMLAILMSRLPPHLTGLHKDGTQNADQEFMLQYIVVSILIITFFMIRSGRYTFFYHFMWKYNIPRRVWSQPAESEPLTADALWQEHWAPPVPAPGPPPPPAQPVHQRLLQWWLLHDWFQGRPLQAPPPDPVAPRGIVQQSLLFLQDIIVFLVSFVLSIFPMWRNLDPQALFPAPRHGGNPAPGGADGLPAVEAPRDPAANDDEEGDDAEEEEEEEDEGDDEEE